MNDDTDDNKGKAGCQDGVCLPLKYQQKQSSSSKKVSTDNTCSPETANESDNTTTGKKIKIEIISDTMCPWCWVGKRNLESALKQRPEIDAEIHWLPYFLDKDLKEEGTHVREYYQKNYGNALAGEEMNPGLVKAGKDCGLDFETHYIHSRYHRPTIRSHRLIHLAKQQNKQDDMVEALFHMCFHEGKHLNSIPDLVEVANKVGLEIDDVEAYLKSGKDEKEVFEEAKKYADLADGVPTFIFTKRGSELYYSLSGEATTVSFKAVFSYLSSTDADVRETLERKPKRNKEE